MSDLDRLIEAVESGTLDAMQCGKYGAVIAPYCNGHSVTFLTMLSAHDGSLDAARALHEALLPSHGWGAGPWGARVWLYSDHPKWDGSDRHEVDMVNAPARAWLLAILRAYRDSNQAEGER